MLLLLLGPVLAAIAIVFVGAITSSLYVRDLGAAFIAAVAMTAISWLLAVPLDLLEQAVYAATMGSSTPPSQLTAAWHYANYVRAGLLFAVNTVLFVAVALFVSGIEIRGVWGVVLTGILLTLIDFAPLLLAMTVMRTT
jgi:uncharacterized membrane protein YvlD (DUF360 family)